MTRDQEWRMDEGSENRRRRIRTILGGGALALAVAIAVPVGAAAQEMTAGRKAGRGLAAMTLGVLEIPGNVVQESRTNGALSGATVGLGVGLGKFVTRELIGVYEFLTAPFAIPDGYQPVLDPEFPWQYFESQPGRAYGFTGSYLEEEETAIREIPGAVVERGDGALTVRFPSDLLFGSGSSQLSPGARTRLQQLARTLNAHPETRIQILGFTDAVGADAYNLALSNARADSVRSYLVSQGVAATRVDAAGFGKAGALASNDTPDGRRLNRRVEIQVRAGSVAAYR